MSKTKKISKSFIGFLVVSIFIWLLITLSKQYSASLTLPVVYTNIPQDKLLEKEPLKELEVFINATGFTILRSRFHTNSIEIDANELQAKSNSEYFILTKDLKNTIYKQLHSGVQLQEVLRDTIFLNLGSLLSKKVPVKPDLNIEYHIGYDLSSKLKMLPDSILISGKTAQIKNVKEIYLSPLVLEDVKSNFSKKVAIKLPENLKDIKVNTSYVTIKGDVEKYTEGSLEVPFTIKNLPKGVEVTTLNKTVKVVFVVGLSNFSKIDETFFEVICDYGISVENNLNYLIPKLTVMSGLFKSYKVLPNKIDFLIQK